MGVCLRVCLKAVEQGHVRDESMLAVGSLARAVWLRQWRTSHMDLNGAAWSSAVLSTHLTTWS